jgi:CRISPR-associated endonuclease/helicase Cas3
MAYAHSLPGRPVEEWEPLAKQLREVAEVARKPAEPFGGGEAAFLSGRWHDLGKYASDWQAFLAEAGSEAPVLSEVCHSLHREIEGPFLFGGMALPCR